MQPRPSTLDRAERAALRRLREMIREGQHPRPAVKPPAPKPPKSPASAAHQAAVKGSA
jgi:hypothetical protein